jgi:hypothetical protein
MSPPLPSTTPSPPSRSARRTSGDAARSRCSRLGVATPLPAALLLALALGT